MFCRPAVNMLTELMLDAGQDISAVIELMDDEDGDSEREEDLDLEEEPIDAWFELSGHSGVIPAYELCRCCGSLTQDGWER